MEDHFVFTGKVLRGAPNAYMAAGYTDPEEFTKDSTDVLSACRECYAGGGYLQDVLFEGKIPDRFLTVLLLSGLADFLQQMVGEEAAGGEGEEGEANVGAKAN